MRRTKSPNRNERKKNPKPPTTTHNTPEALTGGQLKPNQMAGVTPDNSTKTKSSKKLPSAKAISTPQITSCFFKSKRNNPDCILPEYTMAESKDARRKTRKGSKMGEDEHQDINTEQDQSTHSCIFPCPEAINVEEFKKIPTQEDKMGTILSVLNKLCDKVTEIDININHDTNGITTRLTTVTTQSDQNTTSIQQNKEDVEQLKSKNTMLKGLVNKYSQQLNTLNDKVAMLTARSMNKNITITNLDGDTGKEKCKQTVIMFLKKEVEIDVDESKIYIAHRVGQK